MEDRVVYCLTTIDQSAKRMRTNIDIHMHKFATFLGFDSRERMEHLMVPFLLAAGGFILAVNGFIMAMMGLWLDVLVFFFEWMAMTCVNVLIFQSLPIEDPLDPGTTGLGLMMINAVTCMVEFVIIIADGDVLRNDGHKDILHTLTHIRLGVINIGLVVVIMVIGRLLFNPFMRLIKRMEHIGKRVQTAVESREK